MARYYCMAFQAEASHIGQCSEAWPFRSFAKHHTSPPHIANPESQTQHAVLALGSSTMTWSAVVDHQALVHMLCLEPCGQAAASLWIRALHAPCRCCAWARCMHTGGYCLEEIGSLIRCAAWLAAVYKMIREACATLQDDVLVEAGNARFSW
jgi:hypothetical protein